MTAQPLTPFVRLQSARARLSRLWTVRQDPLRFFLDARDDNPIVPIELGPFRTTVVYDPKTVQHVLMHPEQFDKSTRAQRVMRHLLGDGLLTSQGDLWKSRRRMAQTAFRRPKLSVYARIMHTVSAELAARWRVTRTPVDLNRSMMELTLDIAARCLFDDDLDGEADALDHALCNVLDSFHRMVTQPIHRPELLPVGPAATYRRAIGELDELVHRLIARRRARQMDTRRKRLSGASRETPAQGDDLLHLWLHSGLDDEAIRNEVVTMLLAAHETTANALAWTWTLLSRNPASLRRLREELAPLDSEEALIDASLKRDAMPWTDAVFHETMRLYPPAWMTGRGAVGDQVLQADGHAPITVPAGTPVMMPIHAMHRDPAVWVHPEGFDPDRWLRPPDQGGVAGLRFPDLPYMPFGAGQRKCIGSHFALLEARIAIGTLARQLDVVLESGQELGQAPRVTLRPDGPVWARIQPL